VSAKNIYEKELLIMAGLIPFNREKRDLSTRTDFGNFNNMLDDFFSSDWPFRRPLAFDTFKVDVIEEEKDYVVEAEVPGIDKKDVHVELSDGRLLISIKKDEQTDNSNKNYIHRERRYASMSRSVYLEDAKADGIKAKLENGLLKITVPKVEKPNNSVTIDVD